MSDHPLGAPAELKPAPGIHFTAYASLAKAMNRPVVVRTPGRAVFGDSSAVYVAQVSEGASPLLTIKATSYIHGWAVDAGKLYLLDGVELTRWDLLEGKAPEKTLKLLSGDSAAKALDAYADLQKAIQRVEWAALLEQAEDEWLKLTAEQAAASPSTDERDGLDELAADFFRMLKSVRTVVGSGGGAKAARARVTALRGELAAKRAEVAPWCFSPPVVRRVDFAEPLRDVFVIQGDGTLYASDKKLAGMSKNSWHKQADLHLAFIDEPDAQWLGYVGGSALRIVDARKLDGEKSHWAPATAPAAGATRSLAAANGQFWWGLDSGVYACKPDAAGLAQLTWQTGTPWVTGQAGRYGVAHTDYTPSPDPNELFEKMNVRGWLEQRPDKAAAFGDGPTAQLILSDDAGKYAAPAAGQSYVLYGPFARAAGGGVVWGGFEAQAGGPLVLLSDSRGVVTLCRYPATQGGNTQLVPRWAAGPLFSSRVAPGSAADRALSAPWPTPSVRVRPERFQELRDGPAASAFIGFQQMIAVAAYGGQPQRPAEFGPRDMRFLLWHVLCNRNAWYDNSPVVGTRDGWEHALNNSFDENTRKALRERFGAPGSVWDIPSGQTGAPDAAWVKACITSKTIPANFDPPWVWRSPPPSLFNGAPPAWYDPWGYNRPGDFVSAQPAPSYFDPFCFDGQLRFPQRPAALESDFKGRVWAAFAESKKDTLRAGAGAEADPQPAADPDALVVAADYERHLTTFQLLPAARSRVTYDAASRAMSHEKPEFGFTKKQVLAQPRVYWAESSTYRTAWCVCAPEFPSARLRLLAAVNPQKGASLWEAFVAAHKAQYGPETAWKIDVCPLPEDALPKIDLDGYNLPARA